MSRTTKFEYINLDENVLLKLPNLELINAKHNSLFKNGKIYEITFDNEMFYIGITVVRSARYLNTKTITSNKTDRK